MCRANISIRIRIRIRNVFVVMVYVFAWVLPVAKPVWSMTRRHSTDERPDLQTAELALCLPLVTRA